MSVLHRLTPTVFLLLPLFMFLSMIVYADVYSDRASLLNDILLSRDPVEYDVLNADIVAQPNGRRGVEGLAVFVNTGTYQAGYKYTARNYSGVYAYVPFLPEVSFRLEIQDITNASAYYTFFTISHSKTAEKYLYVKADVKPVNPEYPYNSSVWIEWGVVEYKSDKGAWEPVQADVKTLIFPTSEISTIQLSILPSFYYYVNESSDTVALVFGFAMRVRGVSRTGHGLEATGDLAYHWLNLTHLGAEGLKMLEGWNIFVGFGAEFVFNNKYIARQSVYARQYYTELHVKYMLSDIAVMSDLLDYNKTFTLFLEGKLPRYIPGNWEIRRVEPAQSAIMGLMPVAIALFITYILTPFVRDNTFRFIVFAVSSTLFFILINNNYVIIVPFALSIVLFFMHRGGWGEWS